MKKFKFSLAALLLIGAALFSSCDDDTEVDTGLKSGDSLSGSITKDLVVDGDVELFGIVHVKNGATLTVKPGSTISADASVLSYLLVEQGGKIVAEGTENEPIVFTSDLKEAGAWGGLHICGKAPINSGATGLSEIGNSVYGGTDAQDNSGVLKYVRVEYSGTILDSEHEANGISLYGVGAGTTMDYVQVYVGKDDGIEFFGGTVSVKHAYVYGASDDSFDWTQGWSGKGQYWIAKQMNNTGDRGIEGDNLSSNNAASPFANPTLSQVTLIGNGVAGKYGMKLREGTKGQISNFVVTNFAKRSIHVEHDQTITNVNDGSLKLDYGKVNSQVSDKPIKYSGDNVSVVDTKKFETSSNISVVDLSTGVTIATTYTGGKDLSASDDWFTSDSKIGAGSDWTANWTK